MENESEGTVKLTRTAAYEGLVALRHVRLRRGVPGVERTPTQQPLLGGTQLMSSDVNRFRTTSWTARKRCACAADLKRRMWRSRCRVGWWETSTRLLA
jgi:hypothetical protein